MDVRRGGGADVKVRLTSSHRHHCEALENKLYKVEKEKEEHEKIREDNLIQTRQVQVIAKGIKSTDILITII